MLLPSEYLHYCSCISTKNTYKAALKYYLTIVSASTNAKNSLDEKWCDYLSHTHDIERDLITFSQKCQTANPPLAPKTINLYSRIVYLYLRECGIELNPHHQRLLKKNRPKNHPITKDYELTRDTVKIILHHADTRQRAEILIALSSGVRIGELLQITTEDIDLTTNPAEIHIPAAVTKTKMPRTIFISTEAARALSDWLAIRPQAKNYKKGERRIFPYSKSNEIARLNRLLKKSNLSIIDKRTQRSQIHFHLFRKFFLTEFKLSASADVAEELAGHIGYLSNSYRRLTHQTMREEYKKAEPRLTIETKIHPISKPKEIHEELDQIRQDILQLHFLYQQIQTAMEKHQS